MSISNTKTRRTSFKDIPFKRQVWLYALALLASLALLMTSWLRMQAAQVSVEESTQSTRDCIDLADRVKALKSSPTLVNSGNQPIQDLARRIESAAESIGIPPSNIVRVWPQEPRRVDNTPYKQKGTLLVVRDVTLQQATALMHQLDTDTRSLSTSSIRLSASISNPDSETELWTLEANLSTLIYAPPNN